MRNEYYQHVTFDGFNEVAWWTEYKAKEPNYFRCTVLESTQFDTFWQYFNNKIILKKKHYKKIFNSEIKHDDEMRTRKNTQDLF